MHDERWTLLGCDSDGGMQRHGGRRTRISRLVHVSDELDRVPQLCSLHCTLLSVIEMLISALFPLAGLQGTQVGSTRHIDAKAETTGYARAFRRAFDSQPQGRLR
jgi:hypothetical protein